MTPKKKKCAFCGENKRLSQYYKAKSNKDGKSNKCIICQQAYNKEYHKDKHKAIKERRRELVYGLKPKEYDRMMIQQGCSCAICGKHEDELKTGLVVDHDHDTGKVRGLLCGKCNTGIGLLSDSVHNLAFAILYLNESYLEFE